MFVSPNTKKNIVIAIGRLSVRPVHSFRVLRSGASKRSHNSSGIRRDDIMTC